MRFTLNFYPTVQLCTPKSSSTRYRKVDSPFSRNLFYVFLHLFTEKLSRVEKYHRMGNHVMGDRDRDLLEDVVGLINRQGKKKIPRYKVSQLANNQSNYECLRRDNS